MKILCSRQRALVKFELHVALMALKHAKARVFKGYKSWRCNNSLDWAISGAKSALTYIDDMAPPPSRKLARVEKTALNNRR